VGKRLAGGGDIGPVGGDAGLRDPDHGLFEPGPAASGAGLVGQVLGLAPVAAGSLVQVGAHLLDPVTAVHGPQRGGKGIGGRVTGRLSKSSLARIWA
jgi:hypothetical protein